MHENHVLASPSRRDYSDLNSVIATRNLPLLVVMLCTAMAILGCEPTPKCPTTSAGDPCHLTGDVGPQPGVPYRADAEASQGMGDADPMVDASQSPETTQDVITNLNDSTTDDDANAEIDSGSESPQDTTNNQNDS